MNNLYTWPRLGATFDEYAWTWEGMNLIQKGVPVSWSPHPQYKTAKDIIYQKTHFRIVKPFLEHPPVFGLVAGSFAILNGASDMYHLSINNIRPLAVILGLISILLVYLLVEEVYDKKTALLSSLLYATIPTVVVGSRIVQNENFFIPVWLLSLWLIAKYIKNKKSLYRNLAALLCVLLVLAKVPWVAASGSIFLIFLYLKQYKNALIFFLGPILGLAIYTIYGFYYDSNLFLSLWGLQLNRYDLTFNSIFAIFTEPFLVDRYMVDGWIYFGWFAFILLLTKDIKKNFIIIFGLLAYFSIFIFAIPNEPGHGWYRYPFYPFLAISIAVFIIDYFKKNLLLTFLFIIMVGTSLLQLSYGIKFGFSFKVFRLFLLSTGIVLIPLFFKNKNIKKLSLLYADAMIIFFILLNIWAVLEYNEQ
ncbi:MAG TPA: glycosyltransferase family 39 protein [Patescibacteria group bacterium]|nr:glycosyltransferase family 39 protein [Patescibacteria group bacterium]